VNLNYFYETPMNLSVIFKSKLYQNNNVILNFWYLCINHLLGESFDVFEFIGHLNAYVCTSVLANYLDKAFWLFIANNSVALQRSDYIIRKVHRIGNSRSVYVTLLFHVVISTSGVVGFDLPCSSKLIIFNVFGTELNRKKYFLNIYNDEFTRYIVFFF